MVDYSKWAALDISSDSDDCHPNIEKETWKRLKARKRAELGIVKKEIILRDKWNTTSVNTNRAQAANAKSASTESSPPSSKTTTESNRGPPPATDDAPSASSAESSTSPSKSDPPESDEVKQVSEDEVKQKHLDLETLSLENRASAVADALDFDARSNPLVFLEENRELLEKFARIKTDKKAEKFLKKRGHLIHEAAEGYLITRAVDLAVEGDEAGKTRVARRCLQMHNLVVSCKQANVKAERGAELFFQRVDNPKFGDEYRREFEKQVTELLLRIEERRRERIEEMQAPVGPGGLDPTEVLNSLPESMQEAFMNKDMEALRAALENMDASEAQVHMQRCIDSGLWVDHSEDIIDDEEVAAAREIPSDLQ